MYNITNPSMNPCQIVDLDKIYEEYFGYITNGTFVEVGGFDGISWSNTLCLSKAGWEGLIFEPQFQYFEQCAINYSKLRLTNADIIQSCVGNETGLIKLYTGYSLATVKPEIVDIYNNIDWFKGIVDKGRFEEVNIDTLNNLLPKYNIPQNFEVLVIDTEGSELDVLKGLNMNSIEQCYFPKMIIIELNELSTEDTLKKDNDEILELLSFNYKQIYSDEINSIFIIK